VSFSGCIDTEKQYVSENKGTGMNSGIDESLDSELLSSELPDTESLTYTQTVKITGVLEIDNGYSIKILDINKPNELIRVSFRKDGNEYDTGILFTNKTYGIEDTNGENIVYSITVDKIADSSFTVDIKYTIYPAIFLETETYEGKNNEIDVKINGDTITRIYRWEYDNKAFSVEYEYDINAYNLYSQRTRNRNFSHFVNDPYDDKLISMITEQMAELADSNGYRRDEIPYIVMAFVQSLPYVSDSASAGYDEYPRFPFETLYHGGGDCEDSSILLAALLYDMGYGVALVEFPGHMGVGVKGAHALQGSYFDYSGIRYYYLETTNSGWEVGMIPNEYASFEASVQPILSSYPELHIEFSGNARENNYVTYADLEVEVINIGSAVAEDLVIYTALESTTANLVWDELRTETYEDLDVDETVTYTISNLKAPEGETYRVGIRVWSSNSETEYVYSDWITS
jgi:predicted transglutaminase-like cysteine proteinase